MPFWKISRELNRLKAQISALAGYFYEPLLRAKQHRRRLEPRFQMPGLCQPSSKVAIFLIFQPEGISESTFFTCKYLLENDYAPLLVVNGDISDDDASRLQPLSWKIIRRENYGYDFGGYQDAIWLLQQTRQVPDQLLILNDSIWFPVQSGPSILKEMEARRSDFTGALQLEAYRSKDGATGTKQPFFGSFFIHFKLTAYRHASFDHFWQTYKATSNKYMTIRRGERRFSRAMIDAGISHSYIYSRRMFDSWIAQLTTEALARVLTELVSMDAAHDAIRLQLLQATEKCSSWRLKAIDIIHLMTEKQNILSSAPIASLVDFHVPYIKKSADPHNLRALALIARYHRKGVLHLNEIVYDEICQVLIRHKVNID